MPQEETRAIEILDFWLSAGPSKWFNGGPKFDDACRKFEPIWEKAAGGELDQWAETASGALALLILLDQIPRNIFRGDAKQFSSDAKALLLAKIAVERGYDRTQMMPVKSFYYLPFEHSEDMKDQQLSCDLFRQAGSMEHYHYALIHMDVIARFGRFPHRNEMLERETTPEEKRYLATGGFGA